MLSTKNEIVKLDRKNIREALDGLGKLPSEAVFIGMGIEAEPKPVLLNVSSYSPSPNIVIWDKVARQGLRILKVISEFLFLHRSRVSLKPDELVEFVVLTRHPDEWGELNKYGMGMIGKTSCIGIIPFDSELAGTVIRGLAKWVIENHSSSKNPVLVLIDELENLDKMSTDFKLDLRFLMLRGRMKGVFIIGTASRENFKHVQSWLDGFQAQIEGSDAADVFELMEGDHAIFFYTPQTEMI